MWIDKYLKKLEKPECNIYQRNIRTNEFSEMSIENIITRGGGSEWALLFRACIHSKSIKETVIKVCQHYSYLNSMRFSFWPDLFNFIDNHRDIINNVFKK
ncbi:MAG: hypothetical protein J5846_10160 [Desulfovibrio sp.]|nr:hypothetical protein [Desulfovibrio sp.]